MFGHDCLYDNMIPTIYYLDDFICYIYFLNHTGSVLVTIMWATTAERLRSYCRKMSECKSKIQTRNPARFEDTFQNRKRGEGVSSYSIHKLVRESRLSRSLLLLENHVVCSAVSHRHGIVKVYHSHHWHP